MGKAVSRAPAPPQKFGKPNQKYNAPPGHEQSHKDKSSREQLAEKDLDKTLEDTFPASDPPSH